MECAFTIGEYDEISLDISPKNGDPYILSINFRDINELKDFAGKIENIIKEISYD